MELFNRRNCRNQKPTNSTLLTPTHILSLFHALSLFPTPTLTNSTLFTPLAPLSPFLTLKSTNAHTELILPPTHSHQHSHQTTQTNHLHHTSKPPSHTTTLNTPFHRQISPFNFFKPLPHFTNVPALDWLAHNF